MTVYLDADACPVKDLVYRVAERYGLPLLVVANAPLRVSPRAGIELVVVPGDVEAADNWIAERAGPSDLVLTADIPLAARVLRSGARCLDFRGGEFDANRIGDILANRDLNAYLRSVGATTSGPAAFSAQDRSRFASKLDAAMHRLARTED